MLPLQEQNLQTRNTPFSQQQTTKQEFDALYKQQTSKPD
jgi:hypothetical protein